MEQPPAETPLEAGSPPRPRRPQPSWYHYVVPILGTWFIVVIPIILLQNFELSTGARVLLTVLPIPFLITGGWWAIFRSDRFCDEFELASTRQMESVAFRFLIFWILLGELTRASGMEWSLFEGFDGLSLAFLLGVFLTNRRTYGRWTPP